MFIIFFTFFFLSVLIDVKAEENFNQHSTLEITPKDYLLKDKNYFYFGVKIVLEEGWKTYWKNPGEAGAPLSIEFNDNSGILEKEILFPFPKRFTDYEIETIGYEKEIIFPVRLKLDESKKKITSKINLQYLVCKDICIPISIEKNLNHSLDKSSKDIKKSILYNYLEKVPRQNTNYFSIKELKKISDKKISFKIDDLNFDKINVFAFSNLSTLSTKTFSNNNLSFIEVITDDNFNENEAIDLVISDGQKIEEIKINISDFKLGKETKIFYFLLLALLGGIILNFMPCVLPVLSLKMISLLNVSNESQFLIKKNILSIISGIFFSFISLSILIIFFKSIGTQVGWGFQFQNVYFLFTITIIILIFALNLLGFFEILLPHSLLNKLNKITSSNNNGGYFLSGMFATLMATPCSAPFLGTAIGFSAITSNQNIFFIFSFIALGFSLPYFLILLKPTFLKFIPTPGEWMLNFKFFLGLILLITSSWLMSLLRVPDIINLLIFLAIITLSLIFFKNTKRIFFSFIFTILFLIFIISPFENKSSKFEWMEFDKMTLNKLIQDNKIVLLDFTADWCITCQLNKKTTLENSKLQSFFNKENVLLMRGDWTKRDEKILNFIKSYDRLGIPVNIIYGPNNKEGVILPEILTKKIVIDNINKVKDGEN
mgnify:FL=1